ncbi:MAG TPA: hypothetical protein VK779_02680 [Rhizomicrobium sp.]|jgi:hypothetical protein|nr:hypothetical protein [Rhizomicrobium sp.]
MDRIPSRSDLTTDEMAALRLIVSRSFMSKGSMLRSHRARLIGLGLIQSGMGGLMPTPSGRIVARM